MKTKLKLTVICCLLSAICVSTHAQGTAFTYQGRLNDTGQPANGSYDLTFAVFTDSNGVNQVGSTLTNTAAGITNGLFTVVLDFGSGIFTGTPLWLQIGAETNGASSFTTLAPLQQLTPAPYAIYSPSAGSAATANGVAAGSVTGAGIAGNSVVKSLNNLQDAVTLAAGANVTIIPSGNTLTIASSGGGGGGGSNNWSLTGNSGTTAGVDFLGTTDNQPLELHVNGTLAFRLEPGASGDPNVAGGLGNSLGFNNDGATIGGGTGNSATYEFATVAGGSGNQATGDAATVGGGLNNTASGVVATIGGGGPNNAIGNYATVGGGALNNANGNDATVGGGHGNQATGPGSFVGGGGTDGTSDLGNTASGPASTLSGGLFNSSSGYAATVGGGTQNNATYPYATVAGGASNYATAFYAMVGGGENNTASGQNATVGGGSGNGSAATYATVGGGSGNTNDGFGATIGGGKGNNTSGNYATIAGGLSNVARGNGSFAAGEYATANDDNAFLWGDGSRAGVSQGVNSFSVLATGGAWFFSGAYPAGVKLLANGTQWISISDRNAKKNIVPVDCQAVLEKLAALPIQQWNYKWEKDSDVPNIGPMAQDFKHAFYPGRDDKGIGTLEFDGVELAAIQGLNQKLQEELNRQDAENAKLKQQNDSLAQRLNELEAAVKQLATQK